MTLVFEVEQAKNSELTLKMNNHYIYSKYQPKQDAVKFIESQLDPTANGYVLIGLGLGYHLDVLLEKTTKEIILFLIDSEELVLYKKYHHETLPSQVVIYTKEHDVALDDYQILLPNSFVKALPFEHPLQGILDDLKIRQLGYRQHQQLLENNFLMNKAAEWEGIQHLDGVSAQKTACLVSAGPSLDEAIDFLKQAREKVYLLCVGSALRTLKVFDIVPDALIYTDPLNINTKQLEGMSYTGDLFFLSTAGSNIVAEHLGKKFMILQRDYELAEILAKQLNMPTLNTGGSVATTAFSLLEYMGFGTVILIGQDLGFATNRTHSALSTSNAVLGDLKKSRQVKANDGSYISINRNFATYLRWFEQTFAISNVKVYNTALRGAEIKGATYRTYAEILEDL